MYPHRIRLRGPWEYQPLTEPPLPGGRMTLPCRWGEAGLSGFAGRVRFVRRFGSPHQVNEQERVWLTFAGVEESADVSLNGLPLGRLEGTGPFEFAVTEMLRPRNELRVNVDAASDRGGLWGEVALEIRRTAFLQQVRVWREDSRLHVTGHVAGTCDGMLELYVLQDNTTVHYTPVAAGQSFHVATETPTVATTASPVRIELVNGAVVWYALESPIG